MASAALSEVSHTLRISLPHPLKLRLIPTLRCHLPPQCKSKGFSDISVFVIDVAGRTLVSKTMVGVPNLIPTIAAAKAGAAIGTHSSSRMLKDKYALHDLYTLDTTLALTVALALTPTVTLTRYVPDRTPQLLAMTTLGASVQRPFAAVPGGVLCRDAESGAVIGAIGVSGASADEDEHCAVVGAHACGFQTEPAKSVLQEP